MEVNNLKALEALRAKLVNTRETHLEAIRLNSVRADMVMGFINEVSHLIENQEPA